MNARYQEEGADPQKQARVIDYDGYTIDYLAFGPNDFTELKDWQILLSNDRHGIAYRLGIKEGVYDSNANPISLYLFYSHHLIKDGEAMCDGEKQALDRLIRDYVRIATNVASRMERKDAIGLVIDPMPDWMFQDLEKLLARTKIMYDE